MKILLIDNYDSFTYNLYHYLSSLKCKVEVYRNDKIDINQIKKNKYKKIVISPGPGNPNQAGNCLKIVKNLNCTRALTTIVKNASKKDNIFKLPRLNTNDFFPIKK